MRNKTVSNTLVRLLELLAGANFNASLMFLLIVSVLAVISNTLVFDNQAELYGPMEGNLRLMLLYLCPTELAVYSFCRHKMNYMPIIMLGFFLLVLVVGIDYYGDLNQVPVDENYHWLFLYMGLSHLLFGGIKVGIKA